MQFYLLRKRVCAGLLMALKMGWGAMVWEVRSPSLTLPRGLRNPGREVSSSRTRSSPRSCFSQRERWRWEESELWSCLFMESLFSSSIFTLVCSQVVEQLMRDEQDKPYLKITQRLQFLQFLMFWFPIAELLKKNSASTKLLPTTPYHRLRLDQAKLDDVSKRISSSTRWQTDKEYPPGVWEWISSLNIYWDIFFFSHAIFLALPSSSGQVPITDGAEVQSRPLRLIKYHLSDFLVSFQLRVSSRNLVSYLKQKEAAGVISLQNRWENVFRSTTA